VPLLQDEGVVLGALAQPAPHHGAPLLMHFQHVFARGALVEPEHPLKHGDQGPVWAASVVVSIWGMVVAARAGVTLAEKIEQSGGGAQLCKRFKLQVSPASSSWNRMVGAWALARRRRTSAGRSLQVDYRGVQADVRQQPSGRLTAVSRQRTLMLLD